MKQTEGFKLNSLTPLVKMFKRRWQVIALGMLLGIATIAASIGLLGLSGWFLSASAIAGFTALGIKNFNFYTPAAGVRFLAVLRTAGRYGERIVTHDATLKLLSDIRIWLWQKLQPLPFHQVSKLKRGDILSRLLTDIDVLDQLYLRLLTPLLSFIILIIIGGLVLAYWLPEYAFYLVVCLLVLGTLLPWLGFTLSKQAAILELTAKKHYRNSILEYGTHQIELQIFGLIAKQQHNLQRIENQIYSAQWQLVKNQALIQALLFILHSGIVISALYVAANASIAGEMSPPIVAMLVLAVMGVFELLMPVAMSSQYLSACALAAGRINQLTENSEAMLFGEHQQVAKSGKLEVNQLHLSYDGVEVLPSFDLNIKHGEKVAILGHSGCGKTSLLSVITRLVECHQGVVKLDDIEISHYSEQALRKSITFIEQQPQIYSATLRDNLCIALADGEQVDDLHLEQLLADVELSYLLQQQGLDLWVGDGGWLLSGGELRRLAFARALLRNTPLILLDEPMEGLDLKTEQKMMELMLTIFSETTLLMVTHKFAHLDNFERVIRISED